MGFNDDWKRPEFWDKILLGVCIVVILIILGFIVALMRLS